MANTVGHGHASNPQAYLVYANRAANVYRMNGMGEELVKVEEDIRRFVEEQKKKKPDEDVEEGREGIMKMEASKLADKNTQETANPTPEMQSSDLKKYPVKLKSSKVRELTRRFDSHPISSNHPPTPNNSDATLSHLMGRRPRQNTTGEGTSADGKGNKLVQYL